jgi:spore maturation protein CgeB
VTTPMKIAFFGSSLVSAYWNGAATYYRGIIRALAGRGHQVTFYEPDIYDRQKHRDIPDPSWATVVVYPATSEREVWRSIERAAGADLVIKASGVGAFDELLEAGVLQLKAPGTHVAFWDVDAPATLERVTKNPADCFRQLIPRYDLILTYGGGPRVAQSYRELGARHCELVYNALDPDTHYRVPSDPRFTADFALLANRLPDREARMEEFFLGVAARAQNLRFLLGGNGWHGKLVPWNLTCIGHVYTKDHNAFNCTPRAVLNVNRESMARFGFSPPTRIFEAAGAAACLISDHWEGIESFLEPGREVLVAHNGDDVLAQLQALTPERARSIGEAAYRRVLAEHTYEHRARQIEALLNGGSVSREPLHAAVNG